MKKRCFYSIIVLAAVAVLFVYAPLDDKTNVILISPDEQKVKVVIEIADSLSEHRKGLMYREELGENHGMLFVFEREKILSFWMKNTLIPLDVIFFDSNKSFVSDITMAPCPSDPARAGEADPCPYYSSDSEAQYALEVPAGFVNEHGVGRGWRLNGF